MRRIVWPRSATQTCPVNAGWPYGDWNRAHQRFSWRDSLKVQRRKGEGIAALDTVDHGPRWSTSPSTLGPSTQGSSQRADGQIVTRVNPTCKGLPATIEGIQELDTIHGAPETTPSPPSAGLSTSCPCRRSSQANMRRYVARLCSAMKLWLISRASRWPDRALAGLLRMCQSAPSAIKTTISTSACEERAGISAAFVKQIDPPNARTSMVRVGTELSDPSCWGKVRSVHRPDNPTAWNSISATSTLTLPNLVDDAVAIATNPASLFTSYPNE